MAPVRAGIAAPAASASPTANWATLYFVACYQWDGEPPPREFRAGSGGIFVDMGVHEFDQIRWLSGQEIDARSTPRCRRTGSEPAIPGDAESAQALCALSGGSTGAGLARPALPLGDVCRVEVFGTRDAEECRFLWPPGPRTDFCGRCGCRRKDLRAGRGRRRQGASALDAEAALHAAERASAALAPSP